MGRFAGDFAKGAVLHEPLPEAWTLADHEVTAGLEQVWAAEQTLAAQRLALIAQIDKRGLATRDGATSTAAWLRHRLRIDPGDARRMVTLAAALHTTLPATAEALSGAAINQHQARTIHESMSQLPDDLDPKLHREAEKALIEFADRFVPAQLGRLGGRVLAHVAPEIAEQHDREQIEQAEARAWRERAFTLAPHGVGRVRVTGWLDSESAATVAAAIDSLCGPGHKDASGKETSGKDASGKDDTARQATAVADDLCEPVTPRQRRADALVQVCRIALGHGDLPHHGGQRAHVVVTMPYEPWADATTQAVGQLDNGQKVSPQTLRRMACDADIIPVVLGTDGLPLDVGRRFRLITAGIRKALNIRDGGCAFPACDRPPSWCDGHHIVPWLAGGVTSLDNSVLLCRRHHVIVHENQWHVRLGADKLPEFIPPAYVDPQQRPLRNHYHRMKPTGTQDRPSPDHRSQYHRRT